MKTFLSKRPVQFLPDPPPTRRQVVGQAVKQVVASTTMVAAAAGGLQVVQSAVTPGAPLLAPPHAPGVHALAYTCSDQSAFEKGLQRGHVTLPSSATPAPVRSSVVAPESFGAPVNPEALKNGQTSKAEWQRLLKESKGQAVMVPVGEFDPTRPLVVLSPGRDGSFSSVKTLAELSDTYQVVVGVYDTSGDARDGGLKLATALDALTSYRQALSCERGVAPDRDLRIVAHSMGGIAWTFALEKLKDEGKLDDGVTSQYDSVKFVPLDSPWRGVDLPWALSSSGGVSALHTALRIINQPAKADEIDPAATSLVNRAPVMADLQKVKLPGRVEVQLVGATNDAPVSDMQQMLDPTANMAPGELSPGELENLWSFLRSGSTDPDRMDGWALEGLTRTQGMQQLVRGMLRDVDGAAGLEAMRVAARETSNVGDFQPRYEEVLASTVKIFEGGHSEFIRDNPAVMQYIRDTLA